MPTKYGTFVKRVLFPLNEIKEGTKIVRALRMFEQSQYWSEDRIRDWQLGRLRLLLSHAYKNSKFYNARFKAEGFDPRDFRDFADLEKLPVLKKEDLKNHAKEMVACNLAKRDIHESTTGGTTADYTVFFRDNESLSFKYASTIRHDKWCGWDIGEKEAIIWPASIDFSGKRTWKSTLRNTFLDRKLRIFAGVLDEATLGDICESLDKFAPVLIRGFPNPISIIADFVRSTGKYTIKPHAIKSVGEALSAPARALFEDVFGCKVFNYYLSRESGTIASECEMHSKMHMNAECLYVEFLNRGRKAGFGEPGDIVITDLYNLGMPFIRYQIGDIGIPVRAQCACGRTLPLMDITAGRDSDFFISPHDGAYVMGLSLLVPFVENPKVGQLQAVQDRIDHMTLRVAKVSEFEEENLALFKRTLDSVFHSKMSLSIEYVDSIPHDKSGKYRFAIRKIPPDVGNVKGS
jgi:phenylacetate-CoA ligase